jgi:retron-type reverse transcriptase
MQMRTSTTVADRINVDIDGLRDRINKAHADNPLWEKLSVSQKLRQLIEERLGQLETEKESK